MSAALVASGALRPGQEAKFWEWHGRHSAALSGIPGFVSSDVIPSGAAGSPWRVILNFESADALRAWHDSAEHTSLIGEIAPSFEGGKLDEATPKEDTNQGASIVTEVVFSRVRPNMAHRYREWATRIQAAQAKYPGYRGSYVQAPSKADDGYWTTIIRYASPLQLEAWMSSPERAALLKESKEFIEREELMQLATAFPGWVPFDPVTGEPPANWKAAALIVLPLFPIVMLEIKYVLPALAPLHMNPALVTFFQNCFNVSTTGMVTMPPLVSLFGWWLLPKGDADAKAKTTLKGGLILLGLFALETVLMWKLL